MRRNLVRAAVIVLAGTIVSGGAFAQQDEGIVVTATRVPEAKVVKPKPGSIMEKVSLTYGVGYNDLDLTTDKGKDELKGRVRQAAEDACAELDRQYPFAEPKGGACTEAAVDSAKEQVRKAIAAAGGATKKN